MEVLHAKILIIAGLLILTLIFALLPLICLKLTLHQKRRSRKRCQNSVNQLFCCIGSTSNDTYDKNVTKYTLLNCCSKISSFDICQICFRKKFLISTLNCFAGGIFLGTTFICLLPEIRKSFEKITIMSSDVTIGERSAANRTSENEFPENLPIAEIIVVLGLFFILSVEQAAHSCNRWRQDRKRKSQKHDLYTTNSNRDNYVEEGRLPTEFSSFSDSSDDKSLHDYSDFRSLILVASLTVHSLLEGMAIGLEDKVGSVIVLFVSVLSHKSLMAFSMGSNLVHSNQSDVKTILAAFIFAFATPVGIAIGIIMHFSGSNNNNIELVNGVLQAIATGTFLYIAFFEVLVKELESHRHSFAKILSLNSGYCLVLLTFFLTHH